VPLDVMLASSLVQLNLDVARFLNVTLGFAYSTP
jgi:hypothetical protein